MLNVLTLGSLFSGIGGIELGFERTGRFHTIWQCEFDPYASAVLRKHWPGVPNLGDITKVDWAAVEKPDVICGGFPCQDISVAGKGQGIKEGTRSGLWKEYAHAIRELRPRYVIVENVAMLARRGLDIVLGDLAALGYDAEWFTLRASDVGAPHRRERLFIIAHRDDLARAGTAPRFDPGEAWEQAQRGHLQGAGSTNAAVERCGTRSDNRKERQIYQLSSGKWRKVNQQGIDGSCGLTRTLMLPTCGANEHKGLGKDRFDGSPNFHGAKTSEKLRSCSTDPIYLNPSFAELMMGFPVGWSELSASETQSFLPSRRSSRNGCSSSKESSWEGSSKSKTED